MKRLILRGEIGESAPLKSGKQQKMRKKQRSGEILDCQVSPQKKVASVEIISQFGLSGPLTGWRLKEHWGWKSKVRSSLILGCCTVINWSLSKYLLLFASLSVYGCSVCVPAYTGMLSVTAINAPIFYGLKLDTIGLKIFVVIAILYLTSCSALDSYLKQNKPTLLVNHSMQERKDHSAPPCWHLMAIKR